MSSGRQPSLWEALPSLKPRILLIAGQDDPKFVGLANAMAVAMSQSSGTHSPTLVTSASQGQSTAVALSGFSARMCSQTGQLPPFDDEQNIGSSSNCQETEDIMQTSGPCEQPVTGKPPASSLQTAQHLQSLAVPDVHVSESMNSRCRLVPESGHACHVERPEIVAAFLTCFVNSLAATNR